MREYFLHNWRPGAARPAVPRRTREALSELGSFCADIRADVVITDLEAAALAGWLAHYAEAIRTVGLDDLERRLRDILSDLVITDEERAELGPMVDSIIQAIDSQPPEGTTAPFRYDEPAALSPDNGGAVITGNFLLGKRSAIVALLKSQGWQVHDRVNDECGLVLVGSVPSPMWSRGSYGNKIAAVLTLREKGGCAPLLVSEQHWRKLHD